MLALCLIPTIAMAWPTKPITMVVPHTPGGVADQIARGIAPELEKHFKVPVLVKNQPGANHIVALNSVLTKESHDHTFVMAEGGLAAGGYWINPDLVNNFQMISLLGSMPMVFSGTQNASLDSLNQHIRNKQPLTVATTGTDSYQYLWLRSLQRTPDMIPVVYRGGHPAMTDLAGGHVDYAVMSLGLTSQFAQTGKITPLLISSKTRHKMLPDTPTYREFGWQGDPGEFWFGVMATKNLSSQTVLMFNQALETAIQRGALSQLENHGMVLDLKSAESAQQFYLAELDRFAKIRNQVLTQR